MGQTYVVPTKTTTPVANTTAGLWTFANPAWAIFLRNTTTKTINIAFNGNTASATVYDVAPLADAGMITIKAADYGLTDITTVSVWMPTGSTVANLVIRGA